MVKISLNFLMFASPNPGKRLTFHMSPFENMSHTTEMSTASFSFDKVLNVVPLFEGPFYVFVASGTAFTNNFSQTAFFIKSKFTRAGDLEWSIRRLQ